MLTEREYEELKPHREKIFEFATTASYNGDAMFIIDRVRQRHGWGDMCFSCDGSKANALNDAIALITEYELANVTRT